MNIFNLSASELLFYGGIAVMAIALIIAILCVIFFIATVRRLREKLIQEYGEPLA